MRSRAATRPRTTFRRGASYLLGLALFFGVWWGGSVVAGPRVLPGPVPVLSYLASGDVLGDFAIEFLRTAVRALIGFSAAWVLALPAGFLMGRYPTGNRVGFFPLFLLQGAPPLFWITPLVLLLGTDGVVAQAVALLISLPLLTAHVASAIRHIPEDQYDVFRIYAPHGSTIVRELYIPRLLPAVRSNVQLGFLLSIKGAMLAEWFAAQNGFGKQIRIFYQYFAMTEFVGWALLFLIVVGVISVGIRWALDHALPAYRQTTIPSRGVARTRIRDEQNHRESGHAISVHELTFGYDRQPLFSDVSMELSPEVPLVLYGESGCGKTTFARCLSGLLQPWSGTVTGPDRRVLVFQNDALLDHRDAIGNVLLPELRSLSTNALDRAHAALELWGLGEAGSRFPHELSGGMRKRVAMARAWFFDPEVLILDEPFVNLDREARRVLWETLFERLRETPMPCLIITHYPEELDGFNADRRSWNELLSPPAP